MTDEEVTVELRQYDDVGFDALPDWLQTELKARKLSFGPRKPTPMEMEETEGNDVIHRRENNEETVDDLFNYFCKGERYDVQRG